MTERGRWRCPPADGGKNRTTASEKAAGMATPVRTALRFALGLLPVAAVAGVFVGLYQLEILPKEVVAQAAAQLGGTAGLIAVSAVQTVVYALFCGFLGCILAARVGLWKPLRLKKRALLVTLAVSAAGGIVFSLDPWVFGGAIEGLRASVGAGLTVSGVLTAILYGGIVEEVMLRLFLLSLFAWLLWRAFCRKCDRAKIPAGVFAAANIVAAALFAAGHLPATAALFGGLTPLLVLRCFLMNGGFGLGFGWLYRKYGIWYAMLSHALLHLISKAVWALFL